MLEPIAEVIEILKTDEAPLMVAYLERLESEAKWFQNNKNNNIKVFFTEKTIVFSKCKQHFIKDWWLH